MAETPQYATIKTTLRYQDQNGKIIEWMGVKHFEPEEMSMEEAVQEVHEQILMNVTEHNNAIQNSKLN